MSLKLKTQYRDEEGFVHNYAPKSKTKIKYMVIVNERHRDNPMTAYFHDANDAKHFASYYRTPKAKQSGYKVTVKRIEV